MTSFEKIVKYIATAFAALLAVGIVVGILQGILILIGIISGSYGKTIDTSQSFEAKQVRNIRIESSVNLVKIIQLKSEIRIPELLYLTCFGIALPYIYIFQKM